MKILKVLGVVFAMHAAIFMFVFAIPGCRTTARSTPPAPPAETPVTSNTVTYPGAGSSGPVSAAAGDSSSTVSGADLNPGTSGASPMVTFNAGASGNPQHFNPTRPGTAVASALQSGDVIGVTPATTYKVVSNDSLWKIARKHGIGVDDLAKANNLRPGTALKVGQKLIIPGKPTTNASGKGQAGAAGSPWTYTVISGDSLGSIARKNGTTTAAIRSLNPQLKSDLVRVGQDLTLPASALSGSTAAATAPSPVAANGPTSAPAGSIEHIVKPGEGLSLIAKKYGVPLKEIAALNNIANPASLQAGQKIIIPGVKTPNPAAAPLVMPQVEPSPITPSESPVAPAPVVEPSPVAPQAVPDAMQPPVVKVDEAAAPVAPAQN